MIKFDTDRLREILDTLARNKSRTLLTGFGVFWGVFMLVGLTGGGRGLNEMLARNFEGFATNSALIWAQPTTKPFNGFRKGRKWTMDYTDAERLRAHFPELDVVTPELSKWDSKAVAGDHATSCSVKGVMPGFARVCEPTMRYGRYVNDMDVSQRRKVCVIGKRVYRTLFPGGGDPCGRLLRVDSVFYSVVGVDYAESNMSINGQSSESVVLPLTVMQQVYNRGNAVDMICVTGRPGVRISSLAGLIRRVVAARHDVSPDDGKGLMVFDTEQLFSVVDNMFRGIRMLVWLVGLGTLLAGAIGVSNIMMVTVRERTVEIGIRRAIGATPRDILAQIVSESVLLTIVAGMSGLVFVVAVLQAVELANTTDGIVNAHFQVGFATALVAVALLCVMGVAAGMAPALRAMGIKPVDAMRDE